MWLYLLKTNRKREKFLLNKKALSLNQKAVTSELKAVTSEQKDIMSEQRIKRDSLEILSFVLLCLCG
jgi:hypothetical protein